MPRKWTNAFGGERGGSLKHHFVETTPARTVNHKGYAIDLRYVDQILASNSKQASKERKLPRPRR